MPRARNPLRIVTMREDEATEDLCDLRELLAVLVLDCLTVEELEARGKC